VQDTNSSAVPTFLVCLLFISLIAPPYFDYGSLNTEFESSGAGQNLWNKVIWITLFVGSVYFIARRSALWVEVLRKINPFYIGYLALATLSVAWSIEPAATVPRVFRLFVTLLCFTAFTLSNWRPDRFQILVRTLLGTVLVGSVVFAIALPQYGVQKFHDYSAAIANSFYVSKDLQPMLKPVLRGLTFGKNQMGQLASLGVIFWFHAWLEKSTKTLWILLCGGAAVICLIWAHSSTSIIAAAFSIPLMLMLRHWPKWLRRFMPYILVAFSLFMLGYSLVVLRLIPQLDFLLTPITALTGKDLTFSERTAIWKIIIDHIVSSPLLGSGYSAYWVDEPGSPSQQFKTLLNFWPGESHNGYLEVLNDLGAIGGLCLLGFLFTYLRQSIKIMSFDRQQGSLYVVLLFHQFWSSLSESHWFGVDSLSFAVITLAVCTSARTLLQRGFELRAGRAPAYTQVTPRTA
jgi:O-antigen ligase